MSPNPSRRRLLRAVATGGVAGLAGCNSVLPQRSPTGSPGASPDGTSTTPSTDRSPVQVRRVALEPVERGLDAPVAIAFPPTSSRRYVVEQQGVVHVSDDGDRRDRPFLDLRDAVEAGGEKGLLGIALHPEFASNRRLFVRYSAPARPGTPDDFSHTFVLAEFTATDDGTRARRDSERTILEIPQPQPNHNAGDLGFGPDGFLYVAVGDGGGGGDQGIGHVEDWYDRVAGGNGQDVTENLLGSILRIDVNDRSGDRAYSIPEGNPLVGLPGLDEQFAWGFRNPWRFSFDGDRLLVGDVGQNSYEEVDLVERGGNYGWNVKEGSHCYGADSCPDRTPESVRGGEPLRDPVIEYPHSGSGVTGNSVIGGYVYRGGAIPELRGTYVFGDLSASGRLFAATERPEGLWPTRILELAGPGSLRRLLSFGRDHDGDLYALGIGDEGGVAHRLVPA